MVFNLVELVKPLFLPGAAHGPLAGGGRRPIIVAAVGLSGALDSGGRPG